MTEQHYSVNVECEMEYVCVRQGGYTVFVCACACMSTSMNACVCTDVCVCVCVSEIIIANELSQH